MKSNHIRIIGGKHRGRKLPVLDMDGLRPTPNRVRETLFNWLGQELADINTLDLFAGSGLLSFEALSRGAKNITLVEKNKHVAAQLQRNAELFNSDAIHIYRHDALNFIEQHNMAIYDLLFLDPPFGSDLLDTCLTQLNGKLKNNCLLYIETDHDIKSLPINATCLKQQKASQVHFSLFEVQDEKKQHDHSDS